MRQGTSKSAAEDIDATIMAPAATGREAAVESGRRLRHSDTPTTSETFGKVEECFFEGTTDDALARTERPPAYDPESTIAYAAKSEDEPPVEQTALLDWKSAPIPPSRPLTWSAKVAQRAIPHAPVVLVVREERRRARRPPLPLWVHIALASAFVCCVVLLALVIALLYR